MSYTSQQTNAQSLNGILTLTDGILTIEDGNISGVNKLQVQELDTDILNANNTTINTLNVLGDTQINGQLYSNVINSTTINNTGDISTNILYANSIPTVNTNNINSNSIINTGEITTNILNANSIPNVNTNNINSTTINNTGEITTNILNANSIPTVNTTTINSDTIINTGEITTNILNANSIPIINTTTINSTTINNTGEITTNILNASSIPIVNTTTINSATINNSGEITTYILNATSIPTVNTTTINSTTMNNTGEITTNILNATSIPTVNSTTINSTTINNTGITTTNILNSTTINNTGEITSDIGNFDTLNVNIIEAVSLQIETLKLDVLKLTKSLANRFINYTSVFQHVMANRLRAKNADIQHLNLNYKGTSNLMPVGTMIHNFSDKFCTYPSWILCNGQWLKVSEFTNLYSIIGDTFGYRTINGYEEFKLFQGQGLFLRSFTGPTENYYNGNVSYNKAPLNGPQSDNMRSHTHDTTMLYNESFNQYASGGSVGISAVSNIQNYTSGSLTQTQTSTTYTDNNGHTGSSIDETYPMYIGGYLFIKS